jgi:urease accessory protein
MSVHGSLSEPHRPLPAYVRAHGAIRASFAVQSGVTKLARLHEAGGLRLKFPKGEGCEAVIVNTAGGVTGGDRCTITLSAEAGADVVVTTQSAEKIYLAEDAPARIEARLMLAAHARLCYAPQGAILFDGAGLMRNIEADMAGDATLTIMETMMFGRVARGEIMRSGAISDRWRVRRAGRLAFAEDIRLQDDIAESMRTPARGDGAVAIATLLHLSPDAEARLDTVRAALDGAECDCGASAWNDMLVARFAAVSPSHASAAARRALEAVTGAPAPRIWMS